MGNNRLRVVIKGKFLNLIYRGKLTSVYLFYDESRGTFPVGVSNSLDLQIGKSCSATAEIYGRTTKRADQDVSYSLRMDVVNILES